MRNLQGCLALVIIGWISILSVIATGWAFGVGLKLAGL